MWLAKVTRSAHRRASAVCESATASRLSSTITTWCRAGLAPVLQLAERAGLQQLVAEDVRIGEPGGVNADLKIPSLVAGMVAGADSMTWRCRATAGWAGCSPGRNLSRWLRPVGVDPLRWTP